jgi:hypothetical protein
LIYNKTGCKTPKQDKLLEDNLYISLGPKKTAVSYKFRHFIAVITDSTNIRTTKSGLWKITHEDLGAQRIHTLKFFSPTNAPVIKHRNC